MSTTRTRMTVASLAVAGLMLTTFGVATQAPTAHAASPAVTGQERATTQTRGAADAGRSRAAASGFRAVRTLGPLAARGTPLKVTGADADTAFVLWDTSAGAVVERVDVDKRGRTSITRQNLGVNASDAFLSTDAIDAGSDRDVWATVGGVLFHYDGRKWARMALPAGYDAATAVLDRPGEGAVVAVKGARGPAVFPVTARGNRAVWNRTPLGTWADARYATVIDLREAGAKFFARVNPAIPAASVWTNIHEFTGTEWKFRYEASEYGRGAYVKEVAWLAPTADRHVLLSDPIDPGTNTPRALCEAFTRKAPEWSFAACTTKAVSHEGALLRDGRIVTGAFTLRPASGADTETLLKGARGNGVLAMDGAARTNTAWAVTDIAGKAVLQRYRG